MAGMKRFVTYIYAYEEQKKGNNIGFAKVEIRGGELRMEIHLRGVYAAQGECRVYLFRENAGNMEGIPIGTMTLGNGSGDFGVVLKAGQIRESPFGIADMEGIFLLAADDYIFMSRWKEGAPLTVDTAHFREWTREPVQKGASQADAAKTEEKMAETDIAESAAKADGIDIAEAERKIPGIDIAETPGKISSVEKATETRTDEKEENVQATEIPMRNVFPEYDWNEIWESLCRERKLLAPLEDRDARCIQIELKDLRELPKKYWYLGNNSFLLHGFFNYRYLVVGKTGENRWFLGVPGIYQRQERVMAAIFGFPEFLAAAVPGEKGEEEEPVNRFGCWCRYIEE